MTKGCSHDLGFKVLIAIIRRLKKFFIYEFIVNIDMKENHLIVLHALVKSCSDKDAKRILLDPSYLELCVYAFTFKVYLSEQFHYLSCGSFFFFA